MTLKSLTGLFLGAGASCEAGMPLVWDLTGYSFGDVHVNTAFREWLELSPDRRLEIVAPIEQPLPSFLLHLAPRGHDRQSRRNGLSRSIGGHRTPDAG